MHACAWRIVRCSDGQKLTCVQPVSYLSLALTLGTGGGLVWYYNNLKEKKLAGERDGSPASNAARRHEGRT